MKKTALEIIETSIRNSSMTVKEITENTADEIRLYATDGAGLTIMVEFERIHPEDSGIYGSDNDSRIVITDECNEDNFAVMAPLRGNMRSLSACMRLCMDEIIEHA